MDVLINLPFDTLFFRDSMVITLLISLLNRMVAGIEYRSFFMLCSLLEIKMYYKCNSFIHVCQTNCITNVIVLYTFVKRIVLQSYYQHLTIL